MKVHLKNVSIGYTPNSPLITNINFQAKAGEVIVIVGENGIGKTTLMKTVAGLLKPLCGDIELIDKRKIGFAGSDNSKFFSNMTGSEIIYFFETVNSSKVDPAIERIHLVEVIKDKKVQDMSSGMKQILKIVITSLENKELVLWDEPLRGLADLARNEVLEFTKTLSSKKIVIVAEHSLSEWSAVCTQAYLLKNNNWSAL